MAGRLADGLLPAGSLGVNGNAAATRSRMSAPSVRSAARSLRGLRRSTAIALVVALVVVAACTDAQDEPEVLVPAPAVEEAPLTTGAGPGVGVVLPRADAVDPVTADSLAADVRRLERELGRSIGPVQVFQPEGAAFVGDLVGLAVVRRTGLTCLLGAGATSILVPHAQRHPELAFCAAPSDPDGDLPDNVAAIELRAEELGAVVGVAARATAGDGPVGLILGGPELPTEQFRSGLQAALDGTAVIEPGGEPEDALATILAAGAEVVVVDGGVGSRAAIDRAAGQATVIAPAPLLATGDVAAAAVLSWRVRWDLVLLPTIQRRIDPDLPAVSSVGFAEQAFELTIGPAATLTARSRIDDLADVLAAGTVDAADPGVLRDITGLPPVVDADDEDDGDVEDDEDDGDDTEDG
jgi:hypothetical protein